MLLFWYLEFGFLIFFNKFVFGNERGNGRFISFLKKIDIGWYDIIELVYVKVLGW